MYEQSFHVTEEDAGPMFVDDLDEEQTPVKITPSADEMEVLTVPRFSQKLFADTVSQPTPTIDPQVIIQLIMTVSATPGLAMNISSSATSVTPSAPVTTDVLSLTTANAAAIATPVPVTMTPATTAAPITTVTMMMTPVTTTASVVTSARSSVTTIPAVQTVATAGTLTQFTTVTAHPDKPQPSMAKAKKDSTKSKSTSKTTGSTTPATTP